MTESEALGAWELLSPDSQVSLPAGCGLPAQGSLRMLVPGADPELTAPPEPDGPNQPFLSPFLSGGPGVRLALFS